MRAQLYDLGRPKPPAETACMGPERLELELAMAKARRIWLRTAGFWLGFNIWFLTGRWP